MSGLFIKPSDEIKIVFYTVLGPDEELHCNVDKKELLKIEGAKEEAIKEHGIVFRMPNYKDNVETFGKAVKIEGDNVQVDPIALRYMRFCTLLKSWTFKDDNEKSIPPDPRFINELNPILAGLILDELQTLNRQLQYITEAQLWVVLR